MVNISALVHDQNASLLTFLVDKVLLVILHVRVDDGDQAPLITDDLVKHFPRLFERVLVPGEIPFAIGILDVKPN